MPGSGGVLGKFSAKGERFYHIFNEYHVSGDLLSKVMYNLLKH